MSDSQRSEENETWLSYTSTSPSCSTQAPCDAQDEAGTAEIDLLDDAYELPGRRLPGDVRCLDLKEINTKLDRALASRRICDWPGITEKLFSSRLADKLGFSFSDEWVAHHRVFFTYPYPSQGKYLLKHNPMVLPNLSQYSESNLCKYFNAIITSFHRYIHSRTKNNQFQYSQEPRSQFFDTPRRYWSSHFSGKLLFSKQGLQVQPDGVLVNLEGGCEVDLDYIDWSHVHSVMEVTSSRGYTKRMRTTLSVKPFIMFMNQGDRNYTVSLSFRQQNWSVVITDRRGEIRSTSHTYGSIAPLFDVIIALAYLPGEDLGLDNTIIRTNDRHPLQGPTFVELPADMPYIFPMSLPQSDHYVPPVVKNTPLPPLLHYPTLLHNKSGIYAIL
ncbi:hypothetical protein C0991_008918, partial [Blastosporella zonata]